MKFKLAIPTKDGILCEHFGHCQQFYFANIEDGKILDSEFVTPPAHEPGLYPAWVKQQGATEVICGGMGEKAKTLFADQDINPYIGAEIKTPKELADDLINGKLTVGKNACNHK
ncbi:MAG: ATPase [Bacteroidetes bacterium]|nr:ATPase [Bacteroidota bacterium]